MSSTANTVPTNNETTQTTSAEQRTLWQDTVRQLQGELEEQYHWFHQHPEPSYQEYETTKRIASVLTEHGIEILDSGLDTGLVARVMGQAANGNESSEANHVVAVRGDIDALPIDEQTGISRPSLNPGWMHGCGHDYNLTTALGAALALQEHRDEFSGTVKIIFQPAEEVPASEQVPTGSVSVLNTGILDDVEVFYGVHDSNLEEPGTFAIGAGPTSGAVDKFSFSITGRGAHAAHPDRGNSPIPPAVAIVNGIQTLNGQTVDPTHPRVATVTHIESGATWNVIAPTAFVEGTVRTAYPQDREQLHARLSAIADGVATTYDVNVDFHWEFGAPAVVNDEHWAAVAKHAADDLGLRVVAPHPSLGGEDFSYFLAKAPGAFISIGVGNPDRAMHGPTFYPKLDALASGAVLLASTALRTLSELGE